VKRRWEWLAVGIGIGAMALAAYLAVRGVAPAAGETAPGGAAWLIGLGGLLVALWLLYAHTRSGSTDDPVPWSDAGPIIDGTPEAVPQRHPLTGTALVAALQDAGVAARESRDVEDGLVVVRPLLRRVYAEAAVAGGQDREAVEAALDAGTWTDDRVAAAVCSAAVDLPTRSRRQRLLDWLYPGRATNRLTVRAVSAIDAAADEVLPAVIGSDTPRQVPTYAASLAVQDRGADGRLTRAPPVAETDGDETPDSAAEGPDAEVSDA
jgi:hypothetical protein